MTNELKFSTLTAALLSIMLGAPKILADQGGGSPEETGFDVEALKSRGVDISLADWFSQAPRFMPGERNVTLTVNGNDRGKIKAKFDEKGELCADESFQKQAGLLSLENYDADANCYDIKKAWPQADVQLNPNEDRIDLVIPAQAVNNQSTEVSNWSHGGVAGILNYDAQYLDSSGVSSGLNFMQLGSETGMNIDDWIIRSRQTFTRFNGENSMRHQAAYAQRSFTTSKQVLQTGQVGLSNSMFGAGQVLGFQVFPEAALRGNKGGPALVEGFADSQSVVEVRQSGVLVHSTTVPAGPFRLQGFPLLNTRSDLEVTLTGTTGEQRRFTVPASALLLNGNAIAPGLSFGAGKLDQQGSSESPMLATIANGWVLNPHTTLNAGLLGSNVYRAGAIGLDMQPWDNTILSMQTTLSQDVTYGNQGNSFTTSLSHNLSDRIAVNLNGSVQSKGFRELSDAIQEDDLDSTLGRSLNQYGAGVSWATESVGSISFSMAKASSYSGDSTTYVRGGWSKQFGNVYVGASLEHDTGSTTIDADSRFYLTINIPFGNRSVSSYVSTSHNSSRAGLRYSDRSSQDRGWSLSSERDFRSQRVSNSGSMDMVTPISQVSGSVSQDSDNYTSWSARATGALVGHEKGITLSPYRVGDTFGVAKVGDEANVKLDTSSGPTWTNSSGYAVVPSLTGFKRSTIQVDTRSLAKNVDISNAWYETQAARGSVNHINFDVIRTRRVLVNVIGENGNPLPRGASVFDTEGNFVTIAGDKGSIFIPDATNNRVFEVQSSGATICMFQISLPDKINTDELYEVANSHCH
ncbi:fimbria/pilus outer membrane usher protein [Pseudomonas sp. PHC1]|uniref:fimbria/pilus outer membrane usher protein n=1 Tax=Pseudomonas sp. PHC1 TaxID=3384759 RepID=UPI00396F521C